ncbi:hypothetical protein BDY24DRAFT_202751 [Mrakia frigida]|uniref:zinc finger MYND domain-containing protein n=1 Tax=Mrakia frigida TaxID=29902 RepID=UPI003FCBF55F
MDAYLYTLVVLSPASQNQTERSVDAQEVSIFPNLLVLLAPKAPFSRYLREQDSALHFISDMVDFLAASFAAFSVEDMELSPFFSTDSIPGFILRSIFPADPANVPFSRIEQLFSCAPSSLDIIVKRAAELEAIGSVAAEMKAAKLESIIEILERKEPFNVIRDRLENQFLPHIPWHECERLNSQIKLKEKCIEGEKMMYCSVCKCVRYCSKAHQKEHWKWHKQFCFSPTW